MLDAEFMEFGLKIAEGALFMGEPMSDMSRDELLAVAATMLHATLGKNQRDSITEQFIGIGGRAAKSAFG